MMSKVNNIAHRLVPLCLLLVALAGCRKEDTPAPDTPSGTPIAFTPETATKAAVSGVEDIQNDPNGFRVWSWFQGTTSGPMFGADGTPVTYDTATSAWTYSPTRYWMNGIYNFAAVYPATLSGISYESTNESAAPILTIPSFDVKNGEDLLVAFSNNINGGSRTNNDSVLLRFQHKLTKVNVKISQDNNDADNDYYVSRVELSGIKNKRPYTAKPILDKDGNIISLTEEWEICDDEELISTEKIFDPPIRLKDPSLIEPLIDFSVWTDETPLLLIPQHIDGTTMKLRIEYTYDMAGTEDGVGMATFVVKDIPATDIADELWRPGRQITYTIVLSQQTGISFDIPKIEPWSQPLTGGSIIIE